MPTSPPEDPAELQVLYDEAKAQILAAEVALRPFYDEIHRLRCAAQMLYLRLYMAQRGLPPPDEIP